MLFLWGFYYSFGYCKRDRVIVALLRRLHRSRWGNLYLCALWQSRYILNLQYISAFFSLLTVVFLALWFVNFFLTFVKASTTSYGYFHYVSYGIFAHWFSLNQMSKFSVSFATEVERNKPSHRCFNRDLCSAKDLKRATGRLFPPTKNNVTWSPCCYHVIMLSCSFKCLKSGAVMACVWLPPFSFFIFYFSVVCYK